MASGKVAAIVAVGVGLLVAGIAAAARGKGGAGAAGSLPRGGGSVDERVAAAIASGDQAKMLALADALEREGFRDAAEGLRDTAARILAGFEGPAPAVEEARERADDAREDESAAREAAEEARRAGDLEKARKAEEEARRAAEERRKAEDDARRAEEQARQVPSPAPAPQLPRTSQPVPENPRRALAQALTTHLRSIGGLAGRGKEDRTLVARFQTSEGVTADGKYGATAFRRVLSYGLIPVAPFWWPKAKADWQRLKRELTAEVRLAQSGDRARSAEYETLIRDIERS